MCTIMEFEANHFSLGKYCGSGRLSSPEILKLISDNNLCFTCTQVHGSGFKCKLTLTNGTSRVCAKGCSKQSLWTKRLSCTTTRPTLSRSPRSVPTSLFPWSKSRKCLKKNRFWRVSAYFWSVSVLRRFHVTLDNLRLHNFV